jgi:hypothetical protein
LKAAKKKYKDVLKHSGEAKEAQGHDLERVKDEDKVMTVKDDQLVEEETGGLAGSCLT